MVSFRALKQTRLVIQNWIASLVCFKWKKLCFATAPLIYPIRFAAQKVLNTMNNVEIN